MRCRLCADRAGWLRRRCSDCRRLWALWQTHRPAALGELLDLFVAAGVGREKIERFLDAEPRRGGGTIRDHITAEMTNQLLAALGQRPDQDASSVKRLRERGAWKAYDRRPDSSSSF